MRIYQTLSDFFITEIKLGNRNLNALSYDSVMLETFTTLYNKFVPIENLSEDDKKELWKLTRENHPSKTKEELIKISKATYTISFYL